MKNPKVLLFDEHVNETQSETVKPRTIQFSIGHAKIQCTQMTPDIRDAFRLRSWRKKRLLLRYSETRKIQLFWFD